MKQYLKIASIFIMIPLTGACTSSGNEAGDPDKAKSTTYNVKTGRGDRVAMRVLGNATDGYDYHARIRHTTRSDPDPLDRQRVLGDAARTIITKLCSRGANEARPSFSSNYYEQIGRFVCKIK
jgi:hypothetical protein